jgi:large subunit ribosomal protein L28
MAKCEVCGKAIQIGNNVSHSNKKSKKTWHPNIKKLHSVRKGIKSGLNYYLLSHIS